VFVVPQVDGDGYVVTAPFVEALKNLFTEELLKTLVEYVAPVSITKTNALAKGWKKKKKI
jgi:hypothetical protein